ncbi:MULTISPECIES: carbohydrate ABC transporter permease [Caproicibacterium]|uniref:Carbohydrate ABC transporter permease n=1 Tax=Caproicibacterium argilliputei TaxID=3030016 RepID=A0AA97D9Q2_9FIRM|nr:carbohydrate ABC transporter permease [Caproicibacterium argilliputei]WOC32839.1 carbohydrate ABC transporter permease [Caproicibacterium argilliputei]
MRKKAYSFFFHFFCILFSVTALYPILWLVASSFKESQKVFVDSSNLFPFPLHLENYSRGWQGIGGISFSTFYGNSFIVVLLSVLGVLFSCPLIAYGFSRVQFHFKRFWFVTVMITMMLPGQIVMIPQYIIYHKLNWTNTFLPLILPTWCGSAFFIFLIMQFIRSIPYELDEAAMIDGCNQFTIYARIILPLVKPALITAAIFQFYWSWDDFMGPLIYLGKPELFTVSVALRQFSDPTQTDWGAMFSMSALSLIPPILVFFIFQRYIVEGISTSGLKD